MIIELDIGATERLEGYLERVSGFLRDARRRASFAMYALGLLSEGERKSVEPIAARLCGDPEQVRATHDKLLYFLGRADWDDHAVRLAAARLGIEALEQHEPVTTWIIDDTGFEKQGGHSVGVQRQYTGTAGKVTNCQIGVSLSVANESGHLPIDFELYMPESWTIDPARRKEANVPESVRFQTKIELALQMIGRAKNNQIPGNIVLADGDYGKAPLFRKTIRLHNLDYGVGIHSTTSIWCTDAQGQRVGGALTVSELGRRLMQGGYRHIRWREGTEGWLSSRFCLRRVVVNQEDGDDPEKREPVWLLIEWPVGQQVPTKFTLTSLPRRMGIKQLVRILRERWRTEQAYREMKGELGLDHFEGRLFRGWHHHVSVVLCCYAFVVAERARRFSPSAVGTSSARPLPRAA
jgi:SRSO17 transposase